MKKVIILKGLPASGKSTWAKKQLDEHPGKYKRVNKDDLRAMLDNGRWSKENEAMVISLRDTIIIESLNRGKHVIVDDTNLHDKHIEHITKLVQGHAEVEVKMFDITVEQAVQRDLKRLNSVGKDVIVGMYNQFLKPKVEPYIPDKDKMGAFIFDIDGTLAKMDGRGPYDWSRVGEDKVNKPVAAVLDALSRRGYRIIIFTGRDGVCEPETKEWLEDNNIFYEHFDIRPQGNTEKDSIIKRRMLDKIKDKYNVIGVFDDRDQVVDMWREAGLPCYQVAKGNF